MTINSGSSSFICLIRASTPASVLSQLKHCPDSCTATSSLALLTSIPMYRFMIPSMPALASCGLYPSNRSSYSEECACRPVLCDGVLRQDAIELTCAVPSGYRPRHVTCASQCPATILNRKKHTRTRRTQRKNKSEEKKTGVGGSAIGNWTPTVKFVRG